MPLAKVDDKLVTNQTLRNWLEVPTVRVSLPGQTRRATADEVMALGASDLAKVVSTLALYEMANQEALHAPDFVSTETAAVLKARKESLLRERYIEKEVDEKVPRMTGREAKAWYKKNLHLYTEPFVFSAYAIFLSTYKPHRLRPGETLDKLAKDFLGDAHKFNRILDPATSQPISFRLGFYPFLPKPKGGVGKVVLIPMNDRERMAVRRRMDQIVAQLKAGADFVQLAQRYSEDPPAKRGTLIGPLPAPGRPILRTVLDAAIKTPAGQLTPVLETPHGYVILKIVEKHDRPVRPFEEVRDEIIATETKRRRTQARKELNASLFEDPSLRTDRAALMKDGAADSVVIARVGTFQYTWGDYRRDTQRRYSMPKGYENRLQLLKTSARLRQAIIAEKVRQLKLDRDPAVAARIEANESVFRGKAYLDWYVKNRIQVTEQQLRSFYDENRERFREPGRYRLRELILKLGPDELRDSKELEALVRYLREDVKKRATSERRFSRLARSIGTWPLDKSKRGELREVDENYRGARFAAELARLEPGKVAGPYRVGDEIFLLWLRHRSARSYRPFAAVRPVVEAQYRAAHRAELAKIAQNEIRKRHSLQLLFRYEDGGSEDGATTAGQTISP